MTQARNDAELVAWYTAKLTAPDYTREVVPAAAICVRFHLTKQQISNWVDRSDRTGVYRYPGGYDPNEILRWLVMRGDRKRRDSILDEPSNLCVP